MAKCRTKSKLAITKMLTENQVIEAVCRFLELNGWQIIKKARTTQKGHDIIASKKGLGLKIEAKGETSDRQGSARYGRPFDSAQCRDHVANAFYSAAAALHTSGLSELVVGIALPKTPKHRELVNDIKIALDKLEIAVFWVDKDMRVNLDYNIPLKLSDKRKIT